MLSNVFSDTIYHNRRKFLQQRNWKFRLVETIVPISFAKVQSEMIIFQHLCSVSVAHLFKILPVF